MDSRALDTWITREPLGPYECEPVPLRCTCGKFLPVDPTFERESVRVEFCSGEPKVIECRYGDSPGDEGILAIIGEEFRGQTYKVAYPPACGSMAGSTHATFDGEISPDDVEKWKHEPHWFVPEWGFDLTEVRVCSCGHANEEVIT